MGLAIHPICAGFHKMAISGPGPPQSKSNCATTRNSGEPEEARRVPQTGRGRPAACIGETGQHRRTEPDGASPLRPDDARPADSPLTTRRY
jgi:hypothetical protein